MAHNFQEESATIDEKKAGGYGEAIRAFSPSLWRFFISAAPVATVTLGIIAVAQNLFLLRLGFEARFIGLMLGLARRFGLRRRCRQALLAPGSGCVTVF